MNLVESFITIDYLGGHRPYQFIALTSVLAPREKRELGQANALTADVPLAQGVLCLNFDPSHPIHIITLAFFTGFY